MSSAASRPPETDHSPASSGDPSPLHHHVLVFPDRDTAEDAAEEIVSRFAPSGEPQFVRDALAGEDDAEDAQWLVVVDDPAGKLDAAALAAFAEEYEGWLEEE
ncbi:hypothetical protein [Streptomyces sp. NPDC048639]|uniref:hypothetical protein n=1 Tax=Streptomyces sp. NPDC048639 TaxID=3365581 RepID=UPI003715D3FF